MTVAKPKKPGPYHWDSQCAVCGYKPKDLEVYFRVQRFIASQRRTVNYSMCSTCWGDDKSLSNEELEKLDNV